MIKDVYCYRRNIKKCVCRIYQLVFIPDEKEDIIVSTTRIDSSLLVWPKNRLQLFRDTNTHEFM